MSIKKTEAYCRAVVFSGIDDDKIQSSLELAGQKNAFKNLKASYEDNQKNLSYGKFLKCVEINLAKFKNPETSSEIRLAVADKLEETAKTRKESKEAHFKKIHLFFHKFWQGCQGHGFQTKGDYGSKLALKLREIDHSIWKQELKNYIQGKKQAISFEELIKKIRELDKNQFKEFLKIYTKHHHSNTNETNAKLEIYKRLTPEQKKELTDMYADADYLWYLPVYEILKDAKNEDVDDFISDKMMDCFANHVEGVFQVWSYERYHKGRDFDNFAELIIIRGYKKIVNEKNENAKKKLINDADFGNDVKKILKKHGLLS